MKNLRKEHADLDKRIKTLHSPKNKPLISRNYKAKKPSHRIPMGITRTRPTITTKFNESEFIYKPEYVTLPSTEPAPFKSIKVKAAKHNPETRLAVKRIQLDCPLLPIPTKRLKARRIANLR